MRVSWSPLDKNKFLTYTNSVINLFETKIIQDKPIPKGNISFTIMYIHVSYLAMPTKICQSNNISDFLSISHIGNGREEYAKLLCLSLYLSACHIFKVAYSNVFLP